MIITVAGFILSVIIVGSILLLRQKAFENKLFELQIVATQEMAKKEATKIINGDYSGEDIATLRPENLLVVDAKNVIQQYGVGMLEISTIGLRLPIVEGITQTNLSIGVGTVKPNQKLGKGNFALLGHYMTRQELLFGGLKHVAIGDEIQITYYQDEAVYVVKESQIIHQSQGQYLFDDSEEHHWLTLVTCDGRSVGTDYRLMIRAKLKEG